MAKVSVVIPAYNHEQYIAEAVNSVLGQTERDLELIVIDDGSTDATGQVLAGFSDPRLRVLSQPNQGAHAALNRGLEQASGHYLAILNSDDVFHPRRLEETIAALQNAPMTGLAGSHIEVFDQASRRSSVKHGYRDLEPWPLEFPARSFRAGDDLRAALLTENYFSTTSNFVFKREAYERAGLFRPLRYTHDWDFALRLAQVADLILLPAPLLRYRVHDRNTIRENQAAMIFEICWTLAVHLPQQARGPWFGSAGLPERTGQLLYSIYAFGCPNVLVTMLIQGLNDDPVLALELLEPNDPIRAQYLEFIQGQLAKAERPQPEMTPSRPASPLTVAPRRLAKGLVSYLRHRRH